MTQDSKLILPGGATRLDTDSPLKFLTSDGCGPITGYHWPLPSDTEPGEWVYVRGRLSMCTRGLHYTTIPDALGWLQDHVYPLEVDRRYVDREGISKRYCRKARLWPRLTTWNARSARLFSADCAEHAIERRYGQDRERYAPLWDALDVARRYANGNATDDDLHRARSNTYSCVSHSSLTYGVCWAVQVQDDFCSYSYSYLARCTAMSAACTINGGLHSPEKRWQNERLLSYFNGEV